MTQTQNEELKPEPLEVQSQIYLEDAMQELREWDIAAPTAKEIIFENVDPEVFLSPTDREGSAKELWMKPERMDMDATFDDVETALATIERASVDQRLSIEARIDQISDVRKNLKY